MAAEWEKTNLQELDITATDLSSECLASVLARIPALKYLSAGQQDNFTDQVLREFMEKGNIKNLQTVDFDRNENLTEDALIRFLRAQGSMLKGLQLSGIPSLCELFWTSTLPLLRNVK